MILESLSDQRPPPVQEVLPFVPVTTPGVYVRSESDPLVHCRTVATEFHHQWTQSTGGSFQACKLDPAFF